MYGELVPLGGGDNIPLLKKKLVIGRRENCDIVLRFPNISSQHCVLSLKSGYWFIQDLDSRNGVRVNNVRVQVGDKRVDPGDTVTIARHKFELRYEPAKLGAVGAPPPDDDARNIFGKSLLERAGLSGKKVDEVPDEYLDEDPDERPPRGRREK